MSKQFWNEVFIKTLLPSIITVIIITAVEIKKHRKMHWVEICVNLIIGVGTAYLFRNLIHSKYPDPDHATLLISIVTIGSYKAWELVYDAIYKKLDLEGVLKFLLKLFGK